jgi:hypothetical protein
VLFEKIKPIIDDAWRFLGEPSNAPTGEHDKTIAVNIALTKALLNADFSREQQRYLLERSYKKQFQLTEFLDVLRHSYYDPMANSFSVLQGFDPGEETANYVAQAIAVTEYCQDIYAEILGINIQPQPIAEPLDVDMLTFPQILGHMAHITSKLWEALDPGFLEEFNISAYKLGIADGKISPGQIITHFQIDEWRALPPKIGQKK